MGVDDAVKGQVVIEALDICRPRWPTSGWRIGMSRLFVEHREAVAAKIDITRRWLGEQ
jgi:hypothetical protein